MSDLERLRKKFSTATMEIIGTEGLRGAMIRCHPGSRRDSVMVVETTEGIAIMGDYAPGDHGLVSQFGYGFKWFSGELSPDYLCSKFLRKEYQPHLVLQKLREYMEELEMPEAVRHIQESIDALGDEPDESRAFNELSDLGLDDLFTDGCFLYYHQPDADKLVVIQETFARLWKEVARE